jgi:amino acid transporter
MDRIAKYAVLGALVFFFAYFGAAIGTNVEIKWEGSAEIGGVELVTVVLTALSVMLVVLTIFLAALGFIGLSTLNERLREHSKNYFNEELREGQPAFEMLKEAVRNVMYKGIDPILPHEEDLGDDDGPPSS